MTYTYHLVKSGLILLFTLCISAINSQTTLQVDPNLVLDDSIKPLTLEYLEVIPQNAVLFEALGRTVIAGSGNYERTFKGRFRVGFGLGVVYVNSGTIKNVNEEGRYLNMATSQMIYGTCLFGQKRHKPYITVGLTNFFMTDRNSYPSGTELWREANFEVSGGFGYQFNLKRQFIRTTLYVCGLPVSKNNGWFPQYLPWAGVSYGFKF